MEILFLAVFLAVGLSCAGSSRPNMTSPVVTIQSSDGDVIDCIDRLAQPAFSHPLLKDHKIQETPTKLRNIAKKKGEVKWQIWHGNGTKCPKGTIPIRRVAKSPIDGDKVTKGHEYALGYMKNPPKIYGTKVRMNVWQPKIGNASEFSLGQIWLTSGSYKTGDLNSIEAGWQLYPELYQDNLPRLFIFWTTDAYQMTKCYNLRCPGFVQTSGTVVIEGSISPTSSFGGPQTDLTIEIWKDAKLPLWWLAVGLNNGTVLEPVGYWPTKIFTRLTEYAEAVQWGGEIINQNISARHTLTEMGSGYVPDDFRKAAYMCDLQIVVNKSYLRPIYDLQMKETAPAYYKAKKANDTCFYYGGQDSGVDRLQINPVLFYFTFGLFLLF